jgi:hypothetical protein
MSVDRIQALLDEAESLRVVNSASEKAIQVGFESEVQAAWKRKFPRRKFSLKASADKEKGNQPEHGEIYKRWSQKVSEGYKVFKAKLDAIEAQVVGEAAQMAIPAFDGMTLFHTVNSDSYRSQGWGMNKYAQAHAQDYVDKAKSYGLDAHLRKVLTWQGKDSCGHTVTCHDYEVWVSTDRIGVEILSRLPDKETMAEWVAKCDRQGVCARVFAPFMSWEQEEKFREAKSA